MNRLASSDGESAESEAFAPGHITGFFEICDEATDPARIGSRGAGFCVEKGVRSRVRVSPEGFPGIDIAVNGQPDPAGTTRGAVELLLGGSDLHVEVAQAMDLPVSQGFGMSAAGALSAALATAEALGRGRAEAVWAAHTAEVLNRTGLGDVLGASQGGYELRLEPGLAPYGRMEPWNVGGPPAEVALCVVSPQIHTKRILTDPRKRQSINELGLRLVREFAAEQTPQRFAALSHQFSLATKLASAEVLRALDALGPEALASQCMLGGSVFVLGGNPGVLERLRPFGPLVKTKIEHRGARVTVPRTYVSSRRAR